MAAESKLMQTRKKVSTTASVTIEEKRKEVPKGAKILSKDISTTTEQIENGWLVCKCYNIKYEQGTGDNRNTDWAYYTKKWYSKEDPLTITINDSALADAFDEEDA